MSLPRVADPASVRAMPADEDGATQAVELPKDVAATQLLPYAPFSGQKDRLLAQAMLTFRLQAQVDAAALPLHGLGVLDGPPGIGRTSLAGRLASRTAKAFGECAGFQDLEAEPHAVANAGLGREQTVRNLLGEAVAEPAPSGSLMVLLDEAGARIRGE